MWISLGMLIQFYTHVSPLLIFIIITIVVVLLVACIIFMVLRGQFAASSEREQSQVRIQTSSSPSTQTNLSEEAKPTTQEVEVRICECGKWNAMNESVCWRCQVSLSPSNTLTQVSTFNVAFHCAVCSFDVNSGERISLCPACFAQGHRVHMLEFLKAKGTCPACGQKLQPNQLLEVIPTVMASLDSQSSEND